MADKTKQITAGPAGNDDHYATSEEALLSGPLILDVLLNDRKKSDLVSLDADDVAALVDPDSILTPDRSRLGASIWITADGRVGYAMNAAFAQSLAEGETVVDSFLYATRRPNGALVWSTVHVTITGANDAPVASADFAEVPEDVLSTGSVAANDVDPDRGAVLTYSVEGAVPDGFALAGDGSWAFDGSDPAWESIAEGETVELLIPYSVTDEHRATSQSVLTLTLIGRNDAPRAEADLATAAEDGSVSGSVAYNDVDVDHGAILDFALIGPVPAGFSMASDGGWTFDASGPEWQSLAEGETAGLSVSYRVVDEHGAASEATLTVTVEGRNDGPGAQPDYASAGEDSVTTGSVAANDSDPDHGAVLSYALSGSPVAGFSMAPDGSWAFDGSDPAWQSLGAGETVEALIYYVVTDDHGAATESWLTLAVTGTNDSPVVVATRQDGFMQEDGPPTTGEIVFVDADTYDGHDVSVVRLGGGPALGSIAIDGIEIRPGSVGGLLSWHYVPGPGVQALEQGEQVLEQFAVTISDGQGGSATQIVTVAIRGSGDVPVASPATSMVLEDTILVGTLAPFASDVDHHSILAFSAGALPAGFTLSSNGDWSFDARNAAYQALNAGQTMSVVVPWTVTDPTGRSGASTLTIIVHGVNDTVVTAPPPVFNGTGDPNDFDSLVGPGAPNNSAVITASIAGGTITGGPAAQTITGSDSGDTIYGGGGNDVIAGRGNFDRLYGQAGNDTLESGWGVDTLYGGSGDDILRGQTAAAEGQYGTWPITFYGGSGSDTIVGGNNNDILVGGYGADTMTGGGNFDTFVFNSTLDTGDRITDFLYGMDKLDFRGIDANAALAGDQAFLWSRDGVAAANSLWAVRQGADTIIFGDTDGNLGTAEFMLTLQNMFFTEPAGTPTFFML
jgi:VCBS repeat-containing protein